ncbi:MAG: hypothetical protein PHR10_09595 [Sphaerochaetaceae bacterium]|nr:hypothetical protein [Sphaerochaetaceae bacterium]
MIDKRSTRVLTKLHCKETFLNPSYYIAIVVSSLLGYLPIRAFLQSIGPQGFSPADSPLFANITGALERLFSPVMVQKLFAEGPFLFALFWALTPMLLYVLISSIITFQQHKDQGVIELIRFGPSNSRSYILSLFLKDLIAIYIYSIYVTLFFLAVSRFNNLLLGPAFIQALFAFLLATLVLCAYAKLSMVATDSSIGSIFLFLAILAVFLAVQLGTYSIILEQIRTIASLLSLVIQWISPFYYMTIIQTGFELASWLHIVGGILCFVVLTGIVGFISLWLETRKERRL